MFTFNWFGHQSRLALARVVCMTGHLPALSSVFASSYPIVFCKFLRVSANLSALHHKGK